MKIGHRTWQKKEELMLPRVGAGEECGEYHHGPIESRPTIEPIQCHQCDRPTMICLYPGGSILSVGLQSCPTLTLTILAVNITITQTYFDSRKKTFGTAAAQQAPMKASVPCLIAFGLDSDSKIYRVTVYISRNGGGHREEDQEFTK